MKRHLQKAELLQYNKDVAMQMKAYKICKVLFLATLYDTMPDFTEEDGEKLIENIDLLLQSVGWGTDNMNTIVKNLEDYMGHKLI